MKVEGEGKGVVAGYTAVSTWRAVSGDKGSFTCRSSLKGLCAVLGLREMGRARWRASVSGGGWLVEWRVTSRMLCTLAGDTWSIPASLEDDFWSLEYGVRTGSQ